MENQQFRRYSHKVGMNFWHLEWCTKYRYKMMGKLENKNLVEAAIRKAASEHLIRIHELSVMPDHVHVLVSLPHGITDSKALQLLKGRSAFIIFRNKEKFRLRYPKGHFWAVGGFASTVGYTDINTTTSYIQNQEHHHEVAYA
jgi:putative transposase